MDPEDGSNILLIINRKTGKYTLQTQIHYPAVEGTTEFSTNKGGGGTTETERWVCSAGFEYEGNTDGDSVNGNWSKPAIPNQAVTSQAGLLPGSTWNWSMSRKTRR
jgi:hypothetical protein